MAERRLRESEMARQVNELHEYNMRLQGNSSRIGRAGESSVVDWASTNLDDMDVIWNNEGKEEERYHSGDIQLVGPGGTRLMLDVKR